MTRERTDSLPWQDLQLFLALAEAGSLRAAGKRRGLDASTVSRRIASLECRLGCPLFDRTPAGYTLNPTGQLVLERVRRMATAASDILVLGQQDLPVVRIACGAWMARFLTEHIEQLVAAGDPFRIEWHSGNARSDIGRRQTHIGIRNARPVEQRLAGRHLVSVAFAVYRKTSAGRSMYASATGDPAANGERGERATSQSWITLNDTVTPSARWTVKQPGAIVARVSEPTLLLPLLEHGLGSAVLPCVIGDGQASLERVGEPIAELAHEQWLVAHHEDRRLPAVRQVLDRLAELIVAHRAQFAGELPRTSGGDLAGHS